MRLIQKGPRSASIVIVGEAPGEAEARLGEPFIGGSGTILRQMLSRVGGPDLSTMFVTNICHVRPPDNDFNWFFKPAGMQDLTLGLMQLKRDLEEIRPNLIIALGAQPLRMLTGKTGIDKWRGSILECSLVPGLKVIATYHPAYIMRVYDYKAVAEFDLRRAMEQSKFPEIIRPQREFFLNPPDHALRTTLANEMLTAEWLAVDIECWENDQGEWVLACVGFSDRADRALVLDYKEPINKHLIQQLCESPVKKVLQNGTFDMTVLDSCGIKLTNFVWDTMLAHHAIYPECATGSDEMSALAGKKRQAAIAKGLGFLTSIYTEEPYYKDDGKLWRETGDLNLFWLYNARDAAVTREIRDVEEAELLDYGTLGTAQHSMSMVHPLAAATKRGIKIDTEARSKLATELETEITRLQAFLDTAAGGPVNVKSPKQIQDLLYNRLGLKAQYKRGTSGLSTDKDTITKLAGKSGHPALHAILAIRERRDLLERYIQAPIDSDGRMRCSFDIAGTRTGRLSSRKSIYGSGTNLQTIPESLRSMFIADEGRVFLYRDYSQAEARVVAYLAREQGLIDLFNDPTRDIHKENAARIFNVAVADVTKAQRYLAKRVVHASNYGMEAGRLVEIVNQDAETTGVWLDLSTAQFLLDRYFAIFPGIKEHFWSDVRRDIQRSRTLENCFGRKRTFYGRYADELIRDAYSWIPQSTIGDLCTRAMVRIANEIPECELLLNVHDSILVQCLPEQAAHVATRMEHYMRIPLVIHGHQFYVPTDCKLGTNWGNKSETNPNGLEDYDPTS